VRARHAFDRRRWVRQWPVREGIRGSMPTETVSGLGDEAFRLGDQLYVLSGTRQLTIAGDISKDKGMELARTALDRLK
jgi:hypothetical protein